MKRINISLRYIGMALLLGVVSCNGIAQHQTYTLKEKLPKPLKEVSGLMAVGGTIWAISDKPTPVFFGLNNKGKLVQEVRLKDTKVNDVEAITSDNTHLYIGDVGDNDGDRIERQIIRVRMSDIGKRSKVTVPGEAINFSFAGDAIASKKKENNYDCEAMLYFKDSLYLFTKRRADDYAALFVLPARSGTYEARLIGRYKTDGLITDAAINRLGNEVALAGYEDGHKNPFVILFSNFTGNNFFTGTMKRFDLNGSKKDWQVEGITYKDDGSLYFSCEQTKDVPATLYGIKKRSL